MICLNSSKVAGVHLRSCVGIILLVCLLVGHGLVHVVLRGILTKVKCLLVVEALLMESLSEEGVLALSRVSGIQSGRCKLDRCVAKKTKD